LAAWRTWVVASRDDILNRPRRVAMKKGAAEFLECPYCSGFWIALAWWGAFELWPHGALVVAGAVAVTALVPLIEKLTDID
jgi:Protein of unknown function (DUF1360)